MCWGIDAHLSVSSLQGQWRVGPCLCALFICLGVCLLVVYVDICLLVYLFTDFLIYSFTLCVYLLFYS